MAMTRRASRLRNTIQMASTPTPAPVVDPLQAIKDKFARLTELRTQIENAKQLYTEYDNLLEELVPCFISRTDNGWKVKAQITLGEKTYRLHPSFFNAAKNKVVAKTWKSSAASTMTIEG